jgi:hypothetical protein
MQDQWYGDKRDLVKWGTLLELARKYQVTQILQVLYHRSNTWNPIEFAQKAIVNESMKKRGQGFLVPSPLVP